MSNPLTYLNSLFDAFADKTLSGHDQLIILHIFNKFNRAHWPRTVRISDSELLKLCRLYDSTGKPISLDTLRTSKSRLKLKGLIDFKSGKGNAPTEYRFANPPDSPAQSPRDTPPDTPAQSRLSPYSRTCEDVKTLDVKTKENTQSAGAKSSELEGFLNSWTAGNGCARSDWLDGKLAELLDKHGLATMTAALERANRKTNGTHGFNLEFFEKQLAVSQSPKSAQKPKSALKGGESNGETVSKFGYKPVEFDDNEKWW